MGYKIRERREELRLTQEELAKKSGVSRQTISGLESGSVESTSTKTLKAIASALDTTVGNLFFEESV